jgi:hypothetical protein
LLPVTLELLAALGPSTELATLALAADRTFADETPVPEVTVETLNSAERCPQVVSWSASELESATRIATAVTETGSDGWLRRRRGFI